MIKYFLYPEYAFSVVDFNEIGGEMGLTKSLARE